MPAKICCFQPRSAGIGFHELRNSSGTEAGRGNFPCPRHGPEQGAIWHCPRFDPGTYRIDWTGGGSASNRDRGSEAFLVSFAFADGDAQSAVTRFDICDVEGNQLGAAEGAGEAE